MDLDVANQISPSITAQDTVKIHIDAEENGYPEINLLFRKPTLEEISILWSDHLKGNDSTKSGSKFLKTVNLSSSEFDWVFNDGNLMNELALQLTDLINGYPILIEENFDMTQKIKIFKITIVVKEGDENNPVFKIRSPNIEMLGAYTQFVETSFIIATRELYKACWMEGDINILENNDYLVSAVNAMHKVMKRRTDAISKTWLQRQ